MVNFLLSAVAISLSGVMAPGPITAATLAAGIRFRHAGAFIALGHAVIEIPLIVLLVVGCGTFFQFPAVKAGIGLAGGVVLMLMGVQLLLNLRTTNAVSVLPAERRPFLTGIVLTGANPYFLIWWATVGLALATKATEIGIWALLLFGLVHWLCDLVWLETLSLIGFKGYEIMGKRMETVVSLLCAIVLLAFGVKFLYEAATGFMQFTS